MAGLRVLIAGVASGGGGRLAQALEADRDVEAVIAVDGADPTMPLRRAEFVRVDPSSAAGLERIVRAARVDTVIDLTANPRVVAAAPPAGKLIVKSSAHFYGCERGDPAFFTEDMRRSRPPRTARERAAVAAEAAAEAFAERHPDATVTVLRVADEIAPGLDSSIMRLLALPAVPAVLGFDPRMQFVHEDDVVACVLHAIAEDLPGAYNCAADGVLALSEVAALLRKPLAPVLPPLATGAAGLAARTLGLPLAPELLQQLRHGRGLDNRRLKATGYHYRHTTREAVLRLAERPAHVRAVPLRARRGGVPAPQP